MQIKNTCWHSWRQKRLIIVLRNLIACNACHKVLALLAMCISGYYTKNGKMSYMNPRNHPSQFLSFLSKLTWNFSYKWTVSHSIQKLQCLVRSPVDMTDANRFWLKSVKVRKTWLVYLKVKQGKPLPLSLCDCNAKCRLLSVRY